ncbi:MAG: TlpA disulfide reductase family protein [Bacteroidota bacterium]
MIIILLASCWAERTNDHSISEPTVQKQVVLIFENFPADYSINLNDTKGKAYTPAKPELRYYDEHFIQRILKPNTGVIDTIKITCNAESIELRHTVKGFDIFDYIFQRGDTVLFTYENNIPKASISNRFSSDFETNYDSKHREIVCNDDYPALTKITMPFLFVTYNANYITKEGERQGILGQIDRIKSDAKVRFDEELELEEDFLDSLLNEGLISTDRHRWHKQKLKIKRLTQRAYDDVLDRGDIKTNFSGQSDSLLAYHVYRNLITTISSSFYDRKVARVVSVNSNLPDYKVVYDSILASGLFSPTAKEILLFETSDRLIQHGGAGQIKRHIEKVKRDIKDTVLVTHLIDKYQLNKPLSDDLKLLGLNGNRTTLTQLINENTNHVILVDFWASWCVPCIEEFRQSKPLIDELKERNVKFIYLSIDSQNDKWAASSEKYGLPKGYSFIIENKKTSKFLDNLNFSSIPRYLIFNKKGVLEYKNAPRPSNERTLKLIEELLEE